MGEFLTLRQRSTDLIATVSNFETYTSLERSLSVKKIIETALPISEIKRSLPPGEIEKSIDIALTRLVESLNLKYTMNGNQIKILVEDLVDRFKNESIEDFILVFKNARQGQYGEIYRLDSAVVFGWMEQYLDEKYQALEDKLVKEKEQFNTVPQTITEEVKEQQIKDRLRQWHESIVATAEVKKASPLTALEVRQEGQERPKPVTYVVSEHEKLRLMNEHENKLRNARIKYYKEVYPNATDEEIEGFLS